jgi:hypothetical protein
MVMVRAHLRGPYVQYPHVGVDPRDGGGLGAWRLSTSEQTSSIKNFFTLALSPTVSGASSVGQVDPDLDQSHWYRCL